MGCGGSKTQPEKVKQENTKKNRKIPQVKSKHFDVFRDSVFNRIQREEEIQRDRLEKCEEEATSNSIVVWRNYVMECVTFFEIINILGQNENLKELTIDNFEVENHCDTFVNIARVLKKKTTLERLEFSSVMNPGEKAVKSIAKIMESNINLKALCLKKLIINKSEGIFFQNILEKFSPNLTYLEITEIPLSPILTDVLKGFGLNSTLKELVLKKTDLEGSDIDNLLIVLANNKNITSLDLSQNKINRNTNLFLEVDFKHLNCLRLNDCNLDDESFETILSAFKNSKNLQELEVQKNYITETSVDDIKTFFEGNEVLKTLNITSTLLKKDSLFDILPPKDLTKIEGDFDA